MVAAASADLFVCQVGREAALLAELAVHGATHARRLAPGWVIADPPSPAARAPCLAFARQVVPAARAVRGASIGALAGASVDTLRQALSDAVPAWRLHVVAHGAADGPVFTRRAALLRQAILERLGRHRRRLVRRLVHDGPWQPDEAFVQVALPAPDVAFVGVSAEPERQAWGRVLSRFAAGCPAVLRDPAPPSRAYLKLRESLAHLGVDIASGARCVDLGSAPGSWAYEALRRGAQVTAVDRSPLRADLMAHPELTFVRGDAFAFAPEAPVDWLLCDVIAYPERSVALLHDWLQRRWCARFVVTLKFRGAVDGAVLARCKAVLREHAADFAVRALQHNKNEVTAMGASAYLSRP